MPRTSLALRLSMDPCLTLVTVRRGRAQMILASLLPSPEPGIQQALNKCLYWMSGQADWGNLAFRLTDRQLIWHLTSLPNLGSPGKGSGPRVYLGV